MCFVPVVKAEPAKSPVEPVIQAGPDKKEVEVLHAAAAAAAVPAAAIAHTTHEELSFAANGLCPKLFLWHVPDVFALVTALETVACKLRRHGRLNQARGIARAFLALRGVRGTKGIRWLMDECQLADDALLWRGSHHVALRALARKLLVAHDSYTLQHGVPAPWAGHREGRHARFSGRHFLHALTTSAGLEGGRALARTLVNVVLQLSTGTPAKPMLATTLGEVITAVRGRMVLAVSGNRVIFAGPYNAANACFSFWLWAAASGRSSATGLTDEAVFRQVVAAQGPKSRHLLANLGVDSATAFELRRESLLHVVRPWRPPPACNLKSLTKATVMASATHPNRGREHRKAHTDHSRAAVCVAPDE